LSAGSLYLEQPQRPHANVLSETDSLKQPWYMTGANEWVNLIP
jgi:hypothetical protein